MKNFLFIGFFICFSLISRGQYLLHIEQTGSRSGGFAEEQGRQQKKWCSFNRKKNNGKTSLYSILNYPKKFSSEHEREKEIHAIILSLYQLGYLAATIDSFKRDSLNLTAYLHPGDLYLWADIHPGNVDEEILSKTGYRDKIFRSKPFNPEETKMLLEKIIIYYENNGYPFASITLDSVQIAAAGVEDTGKSMISGSLKLTKNKLFHIDSIILNGDAKITERYLHNYISIKPKDLYNEQLVKNISIRLKELPFLTEKQAPQILFYENQSKLLLIINDKKVSTINGILGILPDAYNSDKTIFIGEARMKLINSLGKGELLDVNWRKMQTNTNDLKVIFNYPFLLNTPFGADINFKLYKRDSTFIDINQVYGIQYILTGGKNFRAFVGNQTSNLISTKGYENISVLPNFADISITSYGLGFKAEKLDYRLNPRKGISLDVSGSAGNKQIKKNVKINPSVYDSLELKSVQYKTNLEFDAYLPLLKKSALNFGLQGAYLFNNTLFQNELFRIGGLHTLRGFDEESINASFYSVFTVEYRYLLEQNSYFHIFFDGAYYENKSIYFKGKNFDDPFGFGTGISFDTKAGIFSLSYALGKQFDNPILLKTGKVHFGFVNYF